MMSKHIPGVARGIETVTGTAIVDTGMKVLESCVVSLAQAPNATESLVGWAEVPPQTPGGNVKITLYVFAVDGTTPGASAAKVAWLAEGR